jgi:hypothetical protein
LQGFVPAPWNKPLQRLGCRQAPGDAFEYFKGRITEYFPGESGAFFIVESGYFLPIIRQLPIPKEKNSCQN